MAEDDTYRGRAIRAHTADVVIEAWGPSRAACLEEIVLACAEVVAVGPSATTTERRLDVADPGDDRVLVALLGEVLTLLDTEGVVPLAALVRPAGRSLACVLSVAPLEGVDVVGPSPKGISYEGLALGREGSVWRARAILDV
jgi:SHS2 domain-containing protein